MSTSHDIRILKEQAYQHIARLGKALSSGPRLEILDLVSQGPRTVESIAREVGQSVANTSHHLRTLARAGLVRSEREGLYVTYTIADDDTAALFAHMRSSAEARYRELRATTRDLVEQAGGCDKVDVTTLAARMNSGEVTVIDVRPAGEYQAAHLPGAINIPLAELEGRVDELPIDRDVVAYCRGPLCVMAASAARLMAKRGVRAAVFDRSVADWRAEGLAIAHGGEKAP